MSYGKDVALRILASKKERIDHYKELVTEYLEDQMIKSVAGTVVVGKSQIKDYLEYGDVDGFIEWLEQEEFTVHCAGDVYSISAPLGG